MKRKRRTTKEKIIFAFLIFTFMVNTISAQENEVLKFTHGPYLQNVTCTGATIVFNSNKLIVPGVFIKPEGGKYELVQNSNHGLLNVGNNIHKVRIANLEPGKHYEYKLYAKEILEYHAYKVVYGNEITSNTFSFNTFDPNKKEVGFTVFCDLHFMANKLAKYLDSNDIENQDCYFLNGDIIGHISEEEPIYSGFLDTCVSRFASEKPFFFTRGNHETRGKYARELNKYLDLPGDNFYYAQTIGNTRFVVLDCGEDKPDTATVYAGLADFDRYRMEELEWLKQEVAGSEFKAAGFKIVIVHMPIIVNEKNWHGMEFLAKHYGPVLQAAKIDLMISGHTHKNAWISSSESGFGYPVMVSSNNNYIEAKVNKSAILIHLKDLDGNIVGEHLIKQQEPR